MKKFLPLLLLVLAACTTVQQKPIVAPPLPVVTTPIPSAIPPLDWESGHPERIPWSLALETDVQAALVNFDSASDVTKFCKNYSKLSVNQKIQLWSTMIVWISYYESSWDPTEADVDVGSQDDKDSWSIGLLQMSVVDQANYGLPFGWNYDQTLNPINNLKLGVTIMNALVQKDGFISIGGKSEYHDHSEKGLARYWSTMWNNEDSYSSIINHTNKMEFCQ